MHVRSVIYVLKDDKWIYLHYERPVWFYGVRKLKAWLLCPRTDVGGLQVLPENLARG